MQHVNIDYLRNLRDLREVKEESFLRNLHYLREVKIIGTIARHCFRDFRV